MDQPGDSRASVLFTNNQCGDHQKPVAGREVLRLEVIRMVWKPEDTERRNGHDNKGGSDGCDDVELVIMFLNIIGLMETCKAHCSNCALLAGVRLFLLSPAPDHHHHHHHQ